MAGPPAPSGGGGRPRNVAEVLLRAGAASLIACSNGSADQVTKPAAVGMTSSTPPYASDGEVTIYQVELPVPLPVRRPSDAERKALGSAPAGTPYPRAPFLRAEDERIEVHFVLSNVDDTAHDVYLLFYPWNEFVRWHPGFTVTEEATIPNFGYDKLYSVPAKGRIVGTLTPDQTHEIAIKLASVEKVLASAAAAASAAQAMGAMSSGPDPTTLANHIFDPVNWSNAAPPDLLFTPYIPPVIAGMTGFDLGLRTTEGANVAVEVTIDVVDLQGDRFVAQDDTSVAQLGTPRTVLSPPGARF